MSSSCDSLYDSLYDSLPDEQPVVGPHAAVHHPDVAGDLLDLVGRVVLEQDGLVLLLGGEHHSVDSLKLDLKLILPANQLLP